MVEIRNGHRLQQQPFPRLTGSTSMRGHRQLVQIRFSVFLVVNTLRLWTCRLCTATARRSTRRAHRESLCCAGKPTDRLMCSCCRLTPWPQSSKENSRKQTIFARVGTLFCGKSGKGTPTEQRPTETTAKQYNASRVACPHRSSAGRKFVLSRPFCKNVRDELCVSVGVARSLARWVVGGLSLIHI